MAVGAALVPSNGTVLDVPFYHRLIQQVRGSTIEVVQMRLGDLSPQGWRAHAEEFRGQGKKALGVEGDFGAVNLFAFCAKDGFRSAACNFRVTIGQRAGTGHTLMNSHGLQPAGLRAG